MLNCKQASELMSQAMDIQLPFGKRVSIKFHLIMCHGCSNFLSQIAFLRKAARQFGTCGHCESMRLPDDARKRIKEALKAQDTII
jgi:predicted anti-sigma-YlaC factor YlaD